METAILVIWSIGLLVALGATVVILKQVTLVLRVLKGIHRLSIITRDAARGIARNVEMVPSLPSVEQPLHDFTAAAAALRSNIDGIERKLEMLAEARLPGGK